VKLVTTAVRERGKLLSNIQLVSGTRFSELRGERIMCMLPFLTGFDTTNIIDQHPLTHSYCDDLYALLADPDIRDILLDPTAAAAPPDSSTIQNGGPLMATACRDAADLVNILRAFVPTTLTYQTYDTMLENGRKNRRATATDWTPLETELAKLYTRELEEVGRRTGLEVSAVRVIDTQLRIKRARGLLHVVIVDEKNL
jgi:hypothetical protein